MPQFNAVISYRRAQHDSWQCPSLTTARDVLVRTRSKESPSNPDRIDGRQRTTLVVNRNGSDDVVDNFHHIDVRDNTVDRFQPAGFMISPYILSFAIRRPPGLISFSPGNWPPSPHVDTTEYVSLKSTQGTRACAYVMTVVYTFAN